MRVVYKEPGKDAEIRDIKNELDVLQNLVGGWIECLRFIEGVYMILNEEGKLIGLTPNFYYGWDTIVGPVIFVGDDGEDFTDIADDKIDKVMDFLQYHAF